MAAEGEGDPLLVNEDEVWEDLDELEGQVTAHCTVEQLLREHPQDIIKYIQCKGVATLGELTAPDNCVFCAFQQEQIITAGNNRRKADPKTLWRPLLGCKSADDGPGCGWSSDITLDALVVTIRDVAAPGKDGVLRPLHHRFAAKRCSFAVFALPAVQAVIHFKWGAFARRLLLVEMAFFLAWAAGFTTFTTFIKGEDPSVGLAGVLHTPNGRLSVASELLALLGMAASLGTHACMLMAYWWQWLDAWHLLSIAAYTIKVAVTVMHLGRWGVQSNVFTALLAVQFVVLVLKLQYFTAALRATKFSFLDTVAFVLERLKWYLVFLLLMIWAFGSAFHIIMRGDPKGQEHVDLGDLSYLLLPGYTAEMRRQLASALPLELKPTRMAPDLNPNATYLVTYKIEEYTRVASKLKLWSYPRGHHQYVASIPFKGARVLVADRRFCPLLPPEQQLKPTPGMRVVASQRNQSCTAACAAQGGLQCNAGDFWFINTCSALKAHFPCERGCTIELGPDVPNYVMDPQSPGYRYCLITQKPTRCAAVNPGVARLCPCAQSQQQQQHGQLQQAGGGAGAGGIWWGQEDEQQGLQRLGRGREQSLLIKEALVANRRTGAGA